MPDASSNASLYGYNVVEGTDWIGVSILVFNLFLFGLAFDLPMDLASLADKELISRVESAVAHLSQRHEMLRAAVDPRGSTHTVVSIFLIQFFRLFRRAIVA